MADYGEIVSVLTQLMRAVDHQDKALFADCWTEDAALHITFHDGRDLTFLGRQDLLARTTESWGHGPRSLRHQLGSVAVQETAEGVASAEYYTSYFNVGEAPSFAGMGEYHDLLQRGADRRWRVRERRHRFLTPLVVHLK